MDEPGSDVDQQRDRRDNALHTPGGDGRQPASPRQSAAPAVGPIDWRMAAYALVLGAVCVFLAPITDLWWIVPLLGVAGPLLLRFLGDRPRAGSRIAPQAPLVPAGKRDEPVSANDYRASASPSRDDPPGEARAGGAPPFVLDDPLSEREREVLAVLASGRTTSEAARDLFVSVGTIKSHTANIYRKLGAKNRAQAIARARELGLLP